LNGDDNSPKVKAILDSLVGLQYIVWALPTNSIVNTTSFSLNKFALNPLKMKRLYVEGT